MDKQMHDQKNAPDAASAEVSSMVWVAPIQSITSFSIVEFTQTFSNPGDDSSGTFTQS